MQNGYTLPQDENICLKMDDRKIFSETFLRSTSDIVLSVWFSYHYYYILLATSKCYIHFLSMASGHFTTMTMNLDASLEKVLNFCIHQISRQKNSVHVSSDDIEWYMRLGCNGLSLLRNTIYDKRCKKGGGIASSGFEFFQTGNILVEKVRGMQKNVIYTYYFSQISPFSLNNVPSRKGVSW